MSKSEEVRESTVPHSSKTLPQISGAFSETQCTVQPWQPSGGTSKIHDTQLSQDMQRAAIAGNIMMSNISSIKKVLGPTQNKTAPSNHPREDDHS